MTKVVNSAEFTRQDAAAVGYLVCFLLVRLVVTGENQQLNIPLLFLDARIRHLTSDLQTSVFCFTNRAEFRENFKIFAAL